MKYSSGLAKKEREEIFKLFTENRRLKFSEIEKNIKIRSNMVSYHLEQMQKEGLLQRGIQLPPLRWHCYQGIRGCKGTHPAQHHELLLRLLQRVCEVRGCTLEESTGGLR